MFSKLPAVFVAALAVTAQAAHGKHHHAKRHYYDYAPSNTSITFVTPLPTTSAPSGPLSTISTPILLSTGPAASSTSQAPSESIPLGTGSSALPFSTSSKPGNSTQTGPLGTGVTGAPGTTTIVRSDTTLTVVTSDTTLTYTIGTGSDTTVITTHVKHTSTKTLTHTVYETEAPSAPAKEKAIESPTTTRFSTITSTHFITVVPVTSTEVPVANENHVVASGNGCPAQVTVTITGSPITVTVTATPSPIEPSGSEGSGELPTSSTLPSYSSIRYNNGTEAATSKIVASSGFLTRTSSFTLKPTGTGGSPIGTGAYH